MRVATSIRLTARLTQTATPQMGDSQNSSLGLSDGLIERKHRRLDEWTAGVHDRLRACGVKLAQVKAIREAVDQDSSEQGHGTHLIRLLESGLLNVPDNQNGGGDCFRVDDQHAKVAEGDLDRINLGRGELKVDLDLQSLNDLVREAESAALGLSGPKRLEGTTEIEVNDGRRGAITRQE
mmetsp:Transcript_459/g.854  ORF Transcript_459/g.854 Transcript_459/m.854 type:complete len:180 (-) Transcript_459:1925-2464(-)